MAIEHCDVLTFVQDLAPSWYKPQQVMLAEMICALTERPALNLTEMARSLSSGPQVSRARPLHGRLKRLARFLDNPHLDEAAIFVRWFQLTCRFGADVPPELAGAPIVPLLLDTTYFEPFAALLVSVPCGSRALPIAFTTYHRRTLAACFPPPGTWPTPDTVSYAPARSKTHRPVPASAEVRLWTSQNLIEAQLLDYAYTLVPAPLRPVIVADRGFARASLLRACLAHPRDFVIRFDATTWIYLPDGTGGPVQTALALQPGQRRWLPHAWYGKEDRVPVAVLAVWETGQDEPWYLATSLSDAVTVETLYRWRMRIESGNRDQKSGVILRESGDQHRLTSVLHLHRFLLAVYCTHWLVALTGLQACRDLAAAEAATGAVPTLVSLEQAPPNSSALELLDQGPALPPAIIPHRGPTPPLPEWMKRFAVRGHLSYVRLGLEILRSPDLAYLVRRAVRWLGIYLWPWRPAWLPWQVRYRLKHWWPLPV